jgi:acetylornithine deacetylase/succinyl-diaminopimelate desuccinylase-like protein
VADRFARCQLTQVRIDAAGNAIGRRPGGDGSAPVVVCAHLDTVFPIEPARLVREDRGRLVGPGIGDNGRGLAAMLALAEAIDGQRVRTRRPVEFVATVGEEGLGDLRGIKHLFGAGQPWPAAVVALDGAGDERIVHRALASRRYRVTFRGPGGHSWAAFGAANAVHGAARAATRLAGIALPREPRTTLTVGRIGGGLSVNSIPDEAWIEVDLRSTSGPVIERYDRELRAAVRGAVEEENARRAGGSGALAAAVVVIGDRPGGELPPSDPLVSAALDATRLIGRSPELATASTDANVPIALGVPAIAIGAGGRGGDAHTAAEWFENVEGTLGVARALTIVVAAAGLQ